MRNAIAHGFKGVLGVCLLGSVLACCAEKPAGAVPAVLDDSEFLRAFAKAIVMPAPWEILKGGTHSRRFAAPPGQGWDLRPYGALAIQALRQKAGPGVVRLRWVLKSRVGGMYVAARADVVPSAAPAAIALDIGADSADLVPSGHQRPWDALAAANVTEIELRAETSFAVTAADAVFSVQLSKGGFEKLGNAGRTAPRLLDVSLRPAPPGVRAGAMITFRIDPLPDDPFSAEGEGDVRVVRPNGRQSLAFLDQEYAALLDGSAAIQLPRGPSFFCAYLPEMPRSGRLQILSGRHKWDLRCETLIASADTPAASRAPKKVESPSGAIAVESLPAPRWQPPLEVAPLVNADPATRGLPLAVLGGGRWSFAAEPPPPSELFWRPVPFWKANWGGFGGAGWANGILARQMDALLASAAESGRAQPLVILDGEMFERSGTFNWDSHPLNGTCAGPGDLFRSENGRRFLSRWMRYCIARWGAYKSVSSLRLTPILCAPGSSEFHALAAPLLQDWTEELGLPVYSSHPFAHPPETVKVSGDFVARGRGGWRADHRLGPVYGSAVDDPALDQPCFEVRSPDGRGKNLGFVNTLYFPTPDWRAPAPDNFAAADTLLFDVWVPPGSPADLRLGVHLRDRDSLWFETLVHGMANPGDWRTFTLDLTGINLNGLKAVNHNKAWNEYSRQRVTEIGLHIYSTHTGWTVPGQGLLPLAARFASVRAVKLAPPAAPLKPDIQLAAGAPNNPEKLFPGDLWQCQLTVSKIFENPFDAAECDLSAVITTPSGKEVRVAAFFDQPCARREETPGGDEVVEPLGTEVFTVRYRVIEEGAHRVRFELREGGKYEIAEKRWQPDRRFTPEGKGQAGVGRRGWGLITNYPALHDDGKRPLEKVRFIPGRVTATLELAAPAFTALPGKNPARKHPFRGFLKVAEDRRHFQHGDGTFFYPLGPCVRSPSDNRIPYLDRKWNPADIEHYARRGTYQYDEYFAEFEKAGMNWARVWMSPWWGALEWRRDWPGYQGVGRYNLLNAWRIDHLLEAAEARGIVLDLCLTNHGQYALHVDAEWINNPYNAQLGGPLTAASEFFTRADAKIAHQNKLRYVVARYGHSPAVMAWALFSELEWTEEYEPSFQWNRPDLPTPNIDSWHAEMAVFLKSIDPYGHMVTTHYSQPMRGAGTLALPEIEYATSNAYSAFEEWGDGQYDAAASVAGFWSGVPYSLVSGFKTFNKPGLIEEHGRHWGGGRGNSKAQLDADLHAGLWGAMVQPLGGATGYWWWLHIHYDQKYSEYRALAKFMNGEDMRPAGGESMLEPVYRSKIDPEGSLRGRALKSDRRLYAWIYHRNMPLAGSTPDVAGTELSVGNMKPGAYTIEFWNTYTGEVIGTAEAVVTLQDGKPTSIQVQLPAVKRDLALKLKPKSK